MKTPEAVPTAHVCSLCGQPWDKHPKKKQLTAEDCVKVLKAALEVRPVPYYPNQWRFGTTTISPYLVNN